LHEIENKIEEKVEEKMDEIACLQSRLEYYGNERKKKLQVRFSQKRTKTRV
jgi:hypothetical protein